MTRSVLFVAMIVLLSPVLVRAQEMDHSKMDHSKMDHSKMDHSTPLTPIPELSDADRRAAFPELHHHIHGHGTRTANKVSLNRLEYADSSDRASYAWEGEAWFGGDIQKIKLHTEGRAFKGSGTESHNELLYSRGVRAWWDLNVGVRVDAPSKGSSREWLAIGIEGLAPYKIETAITAYVGKNGSKALKLSAEYDTLLTSRSIVQWQGETEYSNVKVNDDRLQTTIGARWRYEINRQFAPYVGIERAWNVHAPGGHSDDETRAVAGLKVWF